MGDPEDDEDENEEEEKKSEEDEDEEDDDGEEEEEETWRVSFADEFHSDERCGDELRGLVTSKVSSLRSHAHLCK